MNRLGSLFFAGVLALAPLLAAGCAQAAAEMEEFWYLDLDRAIEAATESGRPMLVVFR